MRHLLIPIDLSENSQAAVEAAIKLATPDSVLHLLHVVEMPYPTTAAYVPGVAFGAECQRMHDLGREHLESMAQAVDQAGLRYERTLVTGTPVDEILTCAVKLPADLIVMATHARKGLEHFLLGSTTEAVIRRAPCPVLAVRPQPAEARAATR
ncbi:MAG: universal stress protein [Candidatus Xenobia bacterium]